jgi:sulfur carrier protein ThiS
MDMEVDVSLFATFQSNRFHRSRIQLPKGATVMDLLAKLAISADDVGVLIVNSRDATYRQRLADGDRVTLIPEIGGG